MVSSSSINSHSQLRCSGEIGISKKAAANAIKHSIPGYRSSGIRENDRYVFEFDPCFIKAYLDWLPDGSGFLAPYDQLERSWRKRKIKALLRMPDSSIGVAGLNVIHLIRANVFAGAMSAYLNGLRLRATRKLVPGGIDVDYSQTFQVDRQFIVGEIFTRKRKIQFWRNKLLQDRARVLTLEYETLFDEQSLTGKWDDGEQFVVMPRPTAQRICDFLNIPFRDLTAPQKKLNPPNYEDYIENWDEIKDLQEVIEL